MTELASPDSPDLADALAGTRSAYVHIPFCARVCPYCDFAVVAGRDELVDRYLDALVSEIASEPSWGPLDAVFIGGGTPSRIPSPGIARMLDALRDRFGLAPDAEVSLEANPEDAHPAVAEGLVEAGVNRVSFGVQSFHPAVLAALGRMHDPDQALAAIATSRSAGFRSVSIDLVFGHPVETRQAWEETLGVAVESGVDHVSTYSLTVEPGTELWRQVRRGEPAPDADVQAERWESADEILAAAGFVRYEVSNAARPGHHCLYNLAVWGQAEYLGFGLGAHGHRDGIRRRNVRRLDTYLERIERGLGPVQATEQIDGWAAEQERLMLGLRRAAGVVAGEGGSRLLASVAGRRLQEAGVLVVDGERLRVGRPLLTDAAVAEVLELAPAGD